MYIIRAEFQRFGDVHLPDLIGSIGVYVIWDAHAKARPTYIGEGNILQRFANHVARHGRKFAHPWGGYVAIIVGSTRNVHKEESKAVERLLLDVADDTDRIPIVNARPGSASTVLFFCKDDTLRVAISGFDPLLPPRQARRLTRPRRIKVRHVLANGKDDYQYEHTWRHRRLRAPVI